MVKGKQAMSTNTVLIFGTCFLLLATGMCIAVLLGQLRREKIQKLYKQGKLVIATVTNVQQEREERGPADFPLINYCYYIEAEWTDPQTGITYQFESNRLASSPKEYTPGTLLHVRMDPTNPTRYVMELPEYYV